MILYLRDVSYKYCTQYLSCSNGNQRKLLRATNLDVKLLNYVKATATRHMNQEKTLTKEFFIVHHIFFFDRCSHNF